MADAGLWLVEENVTGGARLSPLALFHRVNSLVPDSQDLLTVPPDTPVSDALDAMKESDFSQLPVVAGSEVLGSFSYRSLARRVPGMSRSVRDYEVEDLADEPVFARVTDELQEILPALDSDGAVFVGDPDNLLAVVTPTDVTAYLFEVTRPFILLQEIELVLRSLIQATCPTEVLSDRVAAAIGHEYRGREENLPTNLDELSLNQLAMVVLNRETYETDFTALLGRNRSSAQDNLGRLGEIRNAVLHFRREASDTDLEQLLSTRAWLLRKARRLAAATT